MPDTAPPDCGTCPDCGLYVSLVHDRATDTTRWETHQIPRCGDTERWCPNGDFELHNCASCSEPISKTMVHSVDDGVRRHMMPMCSDLAREREAGQPASGRYRIDPRYGHTGSITVVELADSGVYEGAVPAMGFRPTARWLPVTGVDPTAPMARVERERDRILAEAAKIISGDRERDYGSAADGFARTGRIWGAMLGLPDIPAETVGYMLAGLKLSRLSTTPNHRDSIVDGPGYFALAGEIALNRTATDEEDF